MKNTPRLILAFAGVLLLSMPALRAADEPTAPPPADHPKREGRGGPGGGGPGAMWDRAAKDLALTDEQQAKWKAIGDEEKTALDAIRNDTSIAREDKRAKAMEASKPFADQRRAVLTADQATKFDEMRAKMKERGPRGGGERPKKDKPE